MKRNRGLLISLNIKESLYEPLRIKEEAEKLGLPVTHFFYEDLRLTFKTNQPMGWLHQEESLREDDYGWAYVRATKYRNYGGYTDLKTIVIQRLLAGGVRVVNGTSFADRPLLSKIIQMRELSAHQLPLVSSWHNGSTTLLAKEVALPCVVKLGLSSMGQGVVKIKTLKKLEEMVGQWGWGNVLIQEYVPLRADYRVMVVGGKAIGAMRRNVGPGGFLTNISAGGWGEKWELSRSLARLAEAAANVFRLDNCGVDLVESPQGKVMILEVNRHPQFQGFEKATGMNVAKKIVEYLVQ